MLRQWRTAIGVNIGAAILAVLAFVVWQQIKARGPAPDTAYNRPGFYELAPDVGYVPRANARLDARSEVDGRKIFDVVYTTGPDHFRVVPAARENPESCVLLFGDSFAFGDGVGDDETFAAQMVRRSGGRVAVHNFAVSGWGPHQFLAGLQSGRFQRAVRCHPTDAVFLMIPSLIWRTSGVTNPWDTNGPRYRLGADGRPVRDGVLGGPDPYNWRRWFGITPVAKDHAIALALAVIVEAMNEVKRLYPGVKTHFISYRVASWTDVDLSVEDMLGFENHLQDAGILPLPLAAVIPRYRFAFRDYILDYPADYHPNARAHRLIAKFLLREISGLPGDG